MLYSSGIRPSSSVYDQSAPEDWPPEIPLKKVKPLAEKEIGRGAYGRVFEVEYRKTQCAAKELHKLLLEGAQHEGTLPVMKEKFLKECNIWSKLQHPRIVHFIGSFMSARHTLQ